MCLSGAISCWQRSVCAADTVPWSGVWLMAGGASSSQTHVLPVLTVIP